MIPRLEPPRLWLRPLELADAEQTRRILPEWEVVRYLAARVPWPYPPDGATTFYRDVALPAMERGEAWHWSLRLKENPEQLIGNITLRRGDDKNRGFWLGLPWQGQGLMSEASESLTHYCFYVLGFPRMRVPKAANNLASRRISDKQGMRLVGTKEQDYVCGQLMAEIWEITAEEWRAARGAGTHNHPHSFEADN